MGLEQVEVASSGPGLGETEAAGEVGLGVGALAAWA
jgi:hypothetical protein